MLEVEKGSLFAGRYIVVRCIGAGGMGAVYLAHDPRYRNFPVALKVLYPGVIKSRELRERFKTEIVASYRISHKNIVRAYEYFDEENMQAYAMEYIEGVDLHQRMKSGPMSFEEVAGLLRQAAAGLEAIHSEGILHRDLKPENIMLTKRGLVKIADFGVARLRDENESITKAGMMVGTPRYFAPEYVELGECDQRGDLFALGVIGYELLAGNSPFSVEEDVSNMMDRFIQRGPSLLEARPDCPVELAAIVEKAIALSLGRRYQSAAQMRLDLEALQKREPLVYAEVRSVAEVVCQVPAEKGKDNSKAEEKQKAKVQENLPPEAAVKELRRLHTSVTVISLLVIALAIALLGVYLYHPRRGTIPNRPSNLVPGQYRGIVNGFGDDGVDLSLEVADGRITAELELPGCSKSELSPENRYMCGQKAYLIRFSMADQFGAVGTIEDLTERTRGSWSVAREEP
ncbi:MAG: serine/threonine protein kinase [Deltaproteobacteria bacterium]|nr:serine/threonine protein kinase [Deltaproteobacteria bacterium]